MEPTEHVHPAVDILDDLIRIQSVNPHFEEGAMGEKGVEDYIENRLKGSGLAVTRQPTSLPGRDNLIIELRTGRPQMTLLFEGHMDTVSLGTMPDPLTPFHRGGRVYGRGACDTKGSLAGMLYAMEQCAKHPERLTADIVLLAAVDEEHEYQGLRAFIRSGTPVVGSVVGEATELGIVVSHKGVVRIALKTYGKAAHTSVPHEGDSAVYQMLHVLDFIRNVIEPELAARSPHPLCGGPTIMVGKITGGTQVNIVPESCEIEIDRRIVPGELAVDVLADFKERLGRFLEGKGVTYTIREILLSWTLNTKSDEPVATYAREAAGLCGLSGDLIGVPYGSDASKLEIAGIPCIVFGPGSISQAHSKDEWVDMDQVGKAAEFYLQMARTFGNKTG